MDRFDLEKFKRNIGVGKKVMIGKDEFYFKPLPAKCYPTLIYVSSKLGKESNDFNDVKVINLLFELLDSFVLNSYPELEVDVRNDFIRDNFIILSATMQELCMTSLNKLSDSQKIEINNMNEQLKNA